LDGCGVCSRPPPPPASVAVAIQASRVPTRWEPRPDTSRGATAESSATHGVCFILGFVVAAAAECIEPIAHIVSFPTMPFDIPLSRMLLLIVGIVRWVSPGVQFVATVVPADVIVVFLLPPSASFMLLVLPCVPGGCPRPLLRRLAGPHRKPPDPCARLTPLSAAARPPQSTPPAPRSVVQRRRGRARPGVSSVLAWNT